MELINILRKDNVESEKAWRQDSMLLVHFHFVTGISNFPYLKNTKEQFAIERPLNDTPLVQSPQSQMDVVAYHGSPPVA